MPDIEELLIMEVWKPPEPGSMPALPDGVELPAVRRTAVTAGFPLQWTEHRGGDVYQRSGMVLQTGPRARSVWAVPTHQRPGEGYAVLVHDVTADDSSAANRAAGTPADFWSSEEWQNPRGLLPRGFQRHDQVFTGDRLDYDVLCLHASDPACPCSPVTFPGQRREPGPASVVDTVYVYGRRFLHPWSVLPLDPGAGPSVGSRYVRLGRCFAGRVVHGQWVPVLPDEVRGAM